MDITGENNQYRIGSIVCAAESNNVCRTSTEWYRSEACWNCEQTEASEHIALADRARRICRRAIVAMNTHSKALGELLGSEEREEAAVSLAAAHGARLDR